jgi:Copper type II ascorbate-dependent monooxygenase, C-terminal domain
LIAAWAPGTGELVMPDNVAMQLPATGYTIETHYNGSGYDQSGFEVCYSDEPRANTAAMHWLGTTNIYGTSATGVCRPTSRVPIHTLAYWPHMHVSGTHVNVTINRATGVSEIWHDAPFDFSNQRLWSSDKVIMPGDTITTTCTYSKPVMYGEGTKNEMCFDVVLAYPVGALTQPGGTGYATNQCVD